MNYLDVGLKLDVEPNVTLDDEVAIKVGLEVSSIVKEVLGPSNSLAYQVGTRSASTALRLKNGETQVLAGLISDEERKTTNHVPGLGEIPLVGRAFGTHRDTSIKTEIILLITPRVLRNIHRPDFGQPALPSGTEQAVGVPPLKIRPTAAKALGMSSSGGQGGGAAAQPSAQPAAAAGGAPSRSTEEESPGGEGLQLAGPAKAAPGSDVDFTIALPGAKGPAEIDLGFDPKIFEPRSLAATAPGRLTLRVEQGLGSVRLRVLPGASGETGIDVIGANYESGETVPGAATAHRIVIGAP